MTAAKRVALIFVLAAVAFLLFVSCQFLADSLAKVLLAGRQELLAAFPNLPENLGRTFWLLVELLPLWIWRNWRDVSALRLGWSWSVLAVSLVGVMHLIGFGKLPPAAHLWGGVGDLLWLNLLIGANEEVIFRGYMFHNRPEVHPKVTVLFSSAAFALFHYINLLHDGDFRGVSMQVFSAFFIGLGLGVVRLATGSIGWCILLHWFVDAAFSFRGPGTERATIAGIIVLPFWLLLILVLFGAHPAMRAAASTGAAIASETGRIGWKRWTAAVLFGLLGGLASLLAVVWQAGWWGAKQTPILVGTLVALALPCFLLSASVLCWQRWRALPWRPKFRYPSPHDTTPLELRAARMGAALLFYVTLMIILFLAILCVGSVQITLPSAPFRQILWDNRVLFGVAAIIIVPPLILAPFALWMALRPRSSWWTTAAWIVAAGCQIFLILAGLIDSLPGITLSSELKRSMWSLGTTELLLAAFLALRHPLLPRRFDWMFPVAVVYPLLLLIRPLVSPALDDWLQNHFATLASASYSGDLAWAIVETFLLLLILAPAWLQRSLRSLGTFRLRLSWTVLLLLPIPLLNLVFMEGWPPGDSRPDVACQLWDGLLIGVTQEIVYRGYLFHGSPQRHPRFVVLFSAVAYAFINVALLPDNAPTDLIQPTALTLVFGLALGVVRLATGSLGWCLLAAVVASVTDGSVNTDGRYPLVAWIVVAVGTLAAAAVIWRHPAFRRVVVAEPQVESLVNDLIPTLPSAEPGH